MRRRSFITTSIAFMAGAAWAEAPSSTPRPVLRPNRSAAPAEKPEVARRPELDDVIARSGLGDGISVLLQGPDGPLTNRMVDAPMPPASVTKAVTAAYALDRLGPNFRFKTVLHGGGEIVGGILQGDLTLCGGGDPTLDTDDLAEFVGALKAAGVTGISGRLRVWAGALPYREEIEPSQLDHLGYNPSISGLNLNFNRVHFEWRRAGSDYTLALDARTELYRPTVKSSRISLSARPSPVFNYEGSDSWTVARSALGKGGSRWLPVRKPSLYAGDVFRTLAAAEGITLPVAEVAETCPTGTPLAVHESQDLRSVLRGMLEYSTNLTAEIVGLTASGKVPLAGSAAAMGDWVKERFGVDMLFFDHSGLNDRNRISAQAMVTLLAGSQRQLWPVMKDIPIMDAPNYPGQVRAKTGTLNFVSTLAGYARTAGGDMLPFTIFSADLEARARGIAAGDELPRGALEWNDRAKRLQDDLLRRWSLISPLDP